MGTHSWKERVAKVDRVPECLILLKWLWLFFWTSYPIMFGYSSQIHFVSWLRLQGIIFITTVYFSITKNEHCGQFTSIELSCNVETIPICLRLFVAKNVVWYRICFPFAHFSDYFYDNLVRSMKINYSEATLPMGRTVYFTKLKSWTKSIYTCR